MQNGAIPGGIKPTWKRSGRCKFPGDTKSTEGGSQTGQDQSKNGRLERKPGPDQDHDRPRWEDIGGGGDKQGAGECRG